MSMVILLFPAATFWASRGLWPAAQGKVPYQGTAAYNRKPASVARGLESSTLVKSGMDFDSGDSASIHGLMALCVKVKMMKIEAHRKQAH